jgi:hypothetical protein
MDSRCATEPTHSHRAPRESKVAYASETWGGTETEKQKDGMGEWGGALGKAKTWRCTHSSRTKLPKDMAPQLMPPIRLPARDSRRFRFTFSWFWLFVEIGLGPVLTKESWRGRLIDESRAAPVAMAVRLCSVVALKSAVCSGYICGRDVLRDPAIGAERREL